LSIVKFILKEINLIRAQRISIILVLIYPIVILLTLAMVFSTGVAEKQYFIGSPNKIDVAVFIPDSTKYFNAQSFLKEMEKHEQIDFHLIKSKEKVKEAIERGIARVGIIISPPKEKGKPIQAHILVDNSALLASSVVVLDAKFALEFLSGEKSREIISDLLGELGKIRNKIGGEVERIDFFVAELDKAENRLLDLNTTINSIDIQTMKVQLDSFDFYYIDSKQKIGNGISEAIQAKQDMDGYKLKLLSAKQELEFYSSSLSQIAESIRVARDLAQEPTKGALSNIYTDLSSQIQKINQAIADIDAALLDIDNAKIKLENAISQLNEAESLLVQTNEAVIGFRETVNTLDNTISEVNALLTDAIAARRQTVENLKSTKILLENLTKTLDDLTAFDPAFLTKPLEITQQALYPVNDLTVMTPMGIVLVILLTAPLLSGLSVIFDKEQGASFRVSVSPTSKLKWLTGKVIGQMVFALIEAILIVLLGIILFGVPIQGSIIELFIGLVIVSLTFVTMGLFIANFSKTQSTTILGALLIIVPMIFLSGIIFPHEFMPEIIESFGKMLPLAQSIEIISGIMVKGLPLITVIGSVIFMLFLSTVFFVSTLLNKEYLK